jgi:hypothetical protein
MKATIENFPAVRQKLDLTSVHGRYSFAASAARVRQLLKSVAF